MQPSSSSPAMLAQQGNAGAVPASLAVPLAQAAKAISSRRFAAARNRYERLLLSHPKLRPAHAGLYYACTALGDTHAAACHLAQALMLQSIVTLPYRGVQPPVRVLLLQSIQAGNALVQRLLDDRIFATSVLLVEFYSPETPLPPHDLVFNAIGDADIRAEALAAAQAILAQTGAPVLNPPSAVLSTTRDGNASRLAGLSGVRTAKTIRLPAAILAHPEAESSLALHGLHFPLLLRAPGFHMGKHFLTVPSAEQLPLAVAELTQNGSAGLASELLAIEFLDARGTPCHADNPSRLTRPDGLFRKYRVLFVDGTILPVHLAVSNDWKVHYFSAEMALYPERRAEDAQFLADMPGVLGASVMQALAAIRAMLALDYGGVDFGLDRDGNLLLFEANANMAVLRPGPEPIWDYRRSAIESVHAAVHAMLLGRAGVNASSVVPRQESQSPAG